MAEPNSILGHSLIRGAMRNNGTGTFSLIILSLTVATDLNKVKYLPTGL
jgi:hypothetical protein